MSNCKAPCKNCPDRHLGCHSDCEKYKEFAEYRRYISDRIKQTNKEYEYDIQKHIRLHKKKNI